MRFAEAEAEGRRLAQRRAEMGDTLMRAADAFERADMVTVQESLGLPPEWLAALPTMPGRKGLASPALRAEGDPPLTTGTFNAPGITATTPLAGTTTQWESPPIRSTPFVPSIYLPMRLKHSTLFTIPFDMEVLNNIPRISLLPSNHNLSSAGAIRATVPLGGETIQTPYIRQWLSPNELDARLLGNNHWDNPYDAVVLYYAKDGFVDGYIEFGGHKGFSGYGFTYDTELVANLALPIRGDRDIKLELVNTHTAGLLFAATECAVPFLDNNVDTECAAGFDVGPVSYRLNPAGENDWGLSLIDLPLPVSPVVNVGVVYKDSERLSLLTTRGALRDYGGLEKFEARHVPYGVGLTGYWIIEETHNSHGQYLTGIQRAQALYGVSLSPQQSVIAVDKSVIQINEGEQQ